jgi:hypothetical protein
MATFPTTIHHYQHQRTLILDLISSIEDESLHFGLQGIAGSPSTSFLQQLTSVKIVDSSFTRGKALVALETYLAELDNQLATQTASIDKEILVDWILDPEVIDVEQPESYEELEHHSLNCYAKSLGLTFPRSWDLWSL